MGYEINTDRYLDEYRPLWLRRSVTGVALVGLRTVPVTFVVDRAALRQAFCLAVLPSTFVSRVSTLPPVFHTHPNMRVSISRRTSGRNLGTIPKATLFRNCRSCGWQTAFILPFTNGQVLLSYRFVSNCFVHSSYLLYLKVLPDLTFWGSC